MEANENPSPVPDIAEHEPVIKPARAKRLYIIVGAAAALLLLGYGVYAFMTSGKQSTDDAQIAADVVAVAARVSGPVVTVYIHENQPVHRGDRIADLDPADAQVKLAQAQSDVETAKAQAADADARMTVTIATAKGGYTAAQAAVQGSRENADTSES